MNWNDWLKIILVLISSIFFLFGFIAGYFYGDKSCIEDPLTYGIKSLNEVNEDNFVCTCSSIMGKTENFYFTEEGLKIGNYLMDYIKIK